MEEPILSIIILSYNTQGLLRDTIASLNKVRGELSFEVIVSDNGSTDGSIEMVKREFSWVKLVENGKNLGFAKGNNMAKKYCKGKYVLFLNSDTQIKKGVLKECINYMERTQSVGAMTCKLVLPDGRLDKDARRSFPTPWVALTHLVLGLDKLFPRSRLFAKYWYGYISPNKIHEVDVIEGAFFLARKKVLNKVGWFDEDYFLNGEDIDLSWKIKNAGWKIIYYPKVSIIHVKGASKGENKKTKRKVPLKGKIKFRMAGVSAMEIFYKKRMWSQYPLFLNLLVLLGIKLLKLVRAVRVIFS